MMLIKMLAKNAVPNPDIANPLTIEETNISTNALITSKKNPRDKTVKGSVRSIRSGLTMALAKPKRRAAITREPPSAKRKPLNI